MKTKRVEVVPYDEKWKLEYFRIRDMLLKHLKGADVGIEHVGSTSVKGLWAKPIIDIDVVIKDYSVFPDIVKILNEAGFVHEGDLGVKGREAFKRKEHVSDNFMPFHLYVCPKDSRELKRHLMFRNYLKRHPEDAAAYSELKRELAKTYQYDAETYCNQKTEFVEDILKKADKEFK